MKLVEKSFESFIAEGNKTLVKEAKFDPAVMSALLAKKKLSQSQKMAATSSVIAVLDWCDAVMKNLGRGSINLYEDEIDDAIEAQSKR